MYHRVIKDSSFKPETCILQIIIEFNSNYLPSLKAFTGLRNNFATGNKMQIYNLRKCFTKFSGLVKLDFLNKYLKSNQLPTAHLYQYCIKQTRQIPKIYNKSTMISKIIHPHQKKKVSSGVLFKCSGVMCFNVGQTK